MVSKAKRTLKDLEKGRPGTRFEHVYEKRQQSAHGKWKNGAFVGAGLATLAAGIATYPIPVIPSEIVIVVGLALLSQGSRHGAMFMDGAELRLRRWFAPALKVWNRWPPWARKTAGVAWMVLVSGLSYWAYRAMAD